jgi:hypothetical protein
MAIPLQQLDQRTVAVEIAFPTETRVMRGSGVYCQDADLGDCLRITIEDPACGTLEILLRQNEWASPIAVDDRHGCDYRLRLDPACLTG